MYILIADRMVETWEDKTESRLFSQQLPFLLPLLTTYSAFLFTYFKLFISSSSFFCSPSYLLPPPPPICSLPLSLPICSLPPSPVDRQRRWFPVNEAITITSRRPLKQNYLIAACNLATHRREQLASPPSSPPPPTSSPHFPHSSLHRRSAVLPVALTCMLVCCASAYFVFM